MIFRRDEPAVHPLRRLRAICIVSIGLGIPSLFAQQNKVSIQGNLEDIDKLQQGQSPDLSSLAPAPEDIAKALLGPGYLLRMDVYRAPEMSLTMMVDASGDVHLPLVGAVHVEGLGLGAASSAIAKALADGQVLKDPQVTLNILQFQSRYVTVIGAVASPGRVPVLAPKTLEDVLAQSGGETQEAGTLIEIEHHDDTGVMSSRRVPYARGESPAVLERELIAPGDTVSVQKAGVVFVLGAVTRPGGYMLVNGGRLNATEAISLAAGTTLVASLKRTLVLRRNGNEIQRIEVPLDRMMRGISPQFELQDQDILYIPNNKLLALYVNTQEIFATASAALIYTAAGR